MRERQRQAESVRERKRNTHLCRAYQPITSFLGYKLLMVSMNCSVKCAISILTESLVQASKALLRMRDCFG